MIIENRNINLTDITGRELQEKGLELFNVLATDEDIQNYPTKQIDPHWHDKFEITVIVQGSAIVSVADKSYRLNEGEACFIRPNTLHGLKPADSAPCRFHSFVADKSSVAGVPGGIYDLRFSTLFENSPNYIHIVKEEKNETFFNNFAVAWNAIKNEEEDYEFRVRESLTSILLFILKKDGALKTRNAEFDERFKRILVFIDEHIHENIAVEDIGNSVYLGKREVQRLFSSYLHTTPMAYVRQRKITMSCIDLYKSEESITEIAYRYAFSSPGHYTCVFEQIIGMKPSSYRISSQSRKPNF